MDRFSLILVACLCGSHLAVAADASSGAPLKLTDESSATKPKVATAKPPTCSRAWIQLLDQWCDGSDFGVCSDMLDKARRLLIDRRRAMAIVLTNPDDFFESEKSWNRYRDAECEVLVPQCPEGQSGSCNLPSAICEVQMDCEHVAHLRTIECQTNGYNRSLQAPPKPNSCK